MSTLTKDLNKVAKDKNLADDFSTAGLFAEINKAGFQLKKVAAGAPSGGGAPAKTDAASAIAAGLGALLKKRRSGNKKRRKEEKSPPISDDYCDSAPFSRLLPTHRSWVFFRFRRFRF